MNLQALRDCVRRQPFVPFTLRLADGRSLTVTHPDFIAVGTRHAVVIEPGDDRTHHVEPLLIVSLEYAGEGAFPSAQPQARDPE